MTCYQAKRVESPLARVASPWNRADVPITIPCSSSIVAVAVYGRGAVVTRNLDLPDTLDDGLADLEVGGITPLSEAGSMRAELDAPDRQLVALQSSLFVPVDPGTPGPSVERVDELSAEIDRLASRRGAMQAERTRLQQLTPSPAKIRSLLRAPQERVSDGLAVGTTIDTLLARLDASLMEIDSTIAERKKERDAAALANSQAKSSERMSTGHPTRRVRLRLDGTGPVRSLRLTYVVKAARWWPVYTLRLLDGGTKATWWMEALVAQLSGEDWTATPLSLSTASLLDDVRLPELASLRIGRTRPEKRRDYRPPPPDLDRMFAGFDGAFPATRTLAAPAPPAPPSPAPRSFTEDTDGFAEDTPSMPKRKESAKHAQRPMPPPPMAAMPMAASFGAPAPGAPPLPRASAPARTRSGMMPQSVQLEASASMDRDDECAMEAPVAAEPMEPTEIEPSDAWLDFDGLRLADGLDRTNRGRLHRKPDPAAAANQRNASMRIEALDPAPGVRDPVSSRGSFDHRYEAEGRAEVPSDGVAHRVPLGSAEATTQSSYRTVPIEKPEVYRELLLVNPFDAPILDGPVDVYVDGSLLVSTQVDRIDRGGNLRIGLGVEDRLRVARNVRVEEETTGLLGGNTAIHHSVRVDLRSSLGKPVTVEVLDRIPDTDEKDIEIKLGKTSHAANRYTQAERGTPIRGGISFTVDLSPGGSETLTYAYRINLPSKNELLGGNRRD